MAAGLGTAGATPQGSALATALLCTSQGFAGSVCGGEEGAWGANPTAIPEEAQCCGQRPHSASAGCGEVLPRALQLVLSVGRAREERAVAGHAGGQGPCPGISSPRAPQLSSQICSSVRAWTKRGDRESINLHHPLYISSIL